jgi:hypothetical protein
MKYSRFVQTLIQSGINLIEKSGHDRRFVWLNAHEVLVEKANSALALFNEETLVSDAITGIADQWIDCKTLSADSFLAHFTFGGCSQQVHDLLHGIFGEQFYGENEQRLRVLTLASSKLLVNKCIALAIALLDWQTFPSLIRGLKSEIDFTLLQPEETMTLGELRNQLGA